jgi:hypothetical protein
VFSKKYLPIFSAMSATGLARCKNECNVFYNAQNGYFWGRERISLLIADDTQTLYNL